MSILRRAGREIFRILPFHLQVPLSRGRPEAAFYIRPLRRELIIDYYLGQFKMHVDPSNDIERRMLSGAYESDTLAMIRRFVKPGDLAIDIGANVGAVTFALADAVGESGRVVACEPGPQFFARLESNLELNPGLRKRILTHRIGLARAEGKLVWQPSITVTGTGSSYTGQIDSNHLVFEIPAITLDRFVERESIERAHFLKIDVDGGELDVLLGGEAFLRKSRPVIYMEVNMWDERTRENARRIDEFLTALGYRIFKIAARTHALAPTRFPDFSFNILAHTD